MSARFDSRVVGRGVECALGVLQVHLEKVPTADLLWKSGEGLSIESTVFCTLAKVPGHLIPEDVFIQPKSAFRPRSLSCFVVYIRTPDDLNSPSPDPQPNPSRTRNSTNLIIPLPTPDPPEFTPHQLSRSALSLSLSLSQRPVQPCAKPALAIHAVSSFSLSPPSFPSPSLSLSLPLPLPHSHPPHPIPHPSHALPHPLPPQPYPSPQSHPS